jgi:hypothetical protein
MRQFMITAGAAAFAIALWAGHGEAEAAPFFVGGLTSQGAPAVDVGYYGRHRSIRSYYAYEDYPYRSYRYRYYGGGGSDEVRELQRFWPQTLWPPSMRYYPYY